MHVPAVCGVAPFALERCFVYRATSPKQRPPTCQEHLEPRQIAFAALHTSNIPQTRSQTVFKMTTFEPSLSSSMRASHDVPSMADQLPSINFGFDDLRSRMNQFTSRFDAFIENGRRRVLEERNQFRMNVAELHGMHFTHALHTAPSCLHASQRINA